MSEAAPPPGRALSLLLGVCGAVAAMLAWQALVPMMRPDPSGASMAVRLGLACAALLPAATVLALMLLLQMALRFAAAAIDPLAGRETRALLRNQRVIANTVEQFAVFAPALLAFAAGATAARMPEVTAAGMVFAGARLLFWLGYLLAPIGRAFGMAATLVTTLGTLAAAIWVWLH
jgi:uncharacterized membrane protein YecN with MAPEG domain